MDMTRLEAFMDAAFAFSVTMMVISVDRVPDNATDLLAAFRNVPAFIASIAVLGLFWRGHWLWSRRYGLEDGISIFISWTMLVTILIYIYPLKVIFGGMWYLLSDRAVGQPLLLQSAVQARALFAVFAIGFTAIALGILLLNLRAYYLRTALRLNEPERITTVGEITGWLIPVSVGILSLVLALTGAAAAGAMERLGLLLAGRARADPQQHPKATGACGSASDLKTQRHGAPSDRKPHG
jgi:hypothetical protein